MSAFVPRVWPALAPRARLLADVPTTSSSFAVTVGPTLLEALVDRGPGGQRIVLASIGRVADLRHPPAPELPDPAPLAPRLPGSSAHEDDEPFYLAREMSRVALQIGLRTDLARLTWEVEDSPAPADFERVAFWSWDWAALGADRP